MIFVKCKTHHDISMLKALTRLLIALKLDRLLQRPRHLASAYISSIKSPLTHYALVTWDNVYVSYSSVLSYLRAFAHTVFLFGILSLSHPPGCLICFINSVWLVCIHFRSQLRSHFLPKVFSDPPQRKRCCVPYVSHSTRHYLIIAFQSTFWKCRKI